MSVAYDNYLREHIDNVKEGYAWFENNLSDLLDGVPDELFAYHDISKYDLDEYEAYDAYFYGGNKSYEVIQNFNLAWLKHIHRYPHHWQHWILINDDPDQGEIILDMPRKYIIEMICDWWSFSWKTGNLYEIFEWYEGRKDYIKLSNYTRMEVMYVLRIMKDKLDKISMEGDSNA